MICNTFSKKDFKEIEESRKIGNTQYYYVRINPKDISEDLVQAVECEINHYPTDEEIVVLTAKYLANLKKGKLLEIKGYDCSPAVNTFIVNGHSVWMDKATRVGLDNALKIQKEQGIERTSIQFGEEWYDLTVDEALNLLAQVELYAMACYKQTSMHLTALQALDIIDEVAAYNYTSGYPEVLEFTV